MGAAFLSSLPAFLSPTLHRNFTIRHQNSECKLNHRNIRISHQERTGRGKLKLRVKAAVNDVVSAAAATDPSQAQVTWQIVVGTLAGVVPFVVAGIEFSKRIVAQRKCTVCGGSGLVLRDNKYYFRCPGCGGFLPWQSWKRFFSG